MEGYRPPRTPIIPPPPVRLAREMAAVSIPIQPVPLMTSLITTPDGRWSSLVRDWGPGETARCGLCPAGSCTARGDRCHLVIEGTVPRDGAPLWSTRGLPRSIGVLGRD